MTSFVTRASVRPFRICVIGSGNWGTTVAKIVSENTVQYPHLFDSRVTMWVHEELINGSPLTEIINTKHENVKYLPDIKLPTNLVAVPNIVDAIRGVNLIIFNVPHQFLVPICKQLKGYIHPHTRAISCLKGINVSEKGCMTLPDYIEKTLGIHCGALSGANLASEIAQGKFSETTVAYRHPQEGSPFKFDKTTIESLSPEQQEELKDLSVEELEKYDLNKDDLYKLFHKPYFHVNVIEDVTGISLAGALKNVVAIAAGFVDGKGWGENAKAAIMRRGLLEMVRFGQTFFSDSDPRTYTEESAGVADLITSCAGGRNHRVGKEYGRLSNGPGPYKSLQELEKELLNGQSAQGILTALEVYKFLEARDALKDFPLMAYTYQIAFEGKDINDLPGILEEVEKHHYEDSPKL